MSETPQKKKKKKKRPYTYLSVLGSCGTADSFRHAGWPTFVDAGIRVFDYVGRTGFPSLVTGALTEGELAETDEATEENRTSWGYQMAAGEVHKRHAKRLLRGAKTNEVLVFDVVSSFIFRELRIGERAFLSSWEVERFFELPAASSRWLWEQPYEPFLDDALRFLGALREKRPELELAFHVAPICRNDGVRFKVDVLNGYVDFYESFCERLSRDLEAKIPRLVTLQGERAAWRADPEHPYGRYPFHYALDYYVAFRKAVKRWLGLPEDTAIDPDAPV